MEVVGNKSCSPSTATDTPSMPDSGDTIKGAVGGRVEDVVAPHCCHTLRFVHRNDSRWDCHGRILFLEPDPDVRCLSSINKNTLGSLRTMGRQKVNPRRFVGVSSLGSPPPVHTKMTLRMWFRCPLLATFETCRRTVTMSGAERKSSVRGQTVPNDTIRKSVSYAPSRRDCSTQAAFMIILEGPLCGDRWQTWRGPQRVEMVLDLLNWRRANRDYIQELVPCLSERAQAAQRRHCWLRAPAP